MRLTQLIPQTLGTSLQVAAASTLVFASEIGEMVGAVHQYEENI